MDAAATETDPNPTATEVVDAMSDAERAFEEGFASDTLDAPGSPAAPLETEARTAPPEPVAPASAAGKGQAPAAVADEDPYAGVREDVKEVLARVPVLEHDLSTTKGRLARATAELEQLKRAPPAQPASARQAEEPRVESLERVRGELPEVADAIADTVRAALARHDIAPAAAPAAATAAAVADEDAPEGGWPVGQKDAAERELHSVHNDWVPVMNSTDFKLWLGLQSEDQRQRIASSDRPAVVADALTRFKAHRERLNAAGQERLRLANLRETRARDAALPQGGAKGSAAPSSTDDAEAAFLAAFSAPTTG